MSTTFHAGGPARRNRRRPPAQRGSGPATGQAGPKPATDHEITSPPSATSFTELGVPAPIVTALATAGAVVPFPIQAATLRSSLAGRDVLGRGRTGSGKTVAFAVPTVVALATSAGSQQARGRQARRPRALILVPTRELAAQVAVVVVPLAQAMDVRVATVHGGVSQVPQVAALRAGVDVLVACPGRLEDLIGQGQCRLDAVEVTVLDEADHLADLGFLPSVRRLLDQTPTGGQRLLFSATLDRGVDDLVRRYLDDPVTHSVDAADASPPELEHHTFTVQPDDKAAVVRELASGAGRSLLSPAPSTPLASWLGSSPCRAYLRSTSTGTSPSRSGRVTSPPLPAGRPACSSPPTSRPVAFTSTTSLSSCTSIPRRSTRRTCTVPGAPLGPAPLAWW